MKDRKKHKIPAAIREAVIERDGYKCFFCSMTRRQSVEAIGHDLDIHHADQTGSHARPNDGTENLFTLCRFCHQKLHAITNKLLARINAGKTQVTQVVVDAPLSLGTVANGRDKAVSRPRRGE